MSEHGSCSLTLICMNQSTTALGASCICACRRAITTVQSSTPGSSLPRLHKKPHAAPDTLYKCMQISLRRYRLRSTPWTFNSEPPNSATNRTNSGSFPSAHDHCGSQHFPPEFPHRALVTVGQIFGKKFQRSSLTSLWQTSCPLTCLGCSVHFVL
jgi:hypothetical protein